VKTTRILLIEDSPGDALLVRQILAELPYPIRLSLARDGEQALMLLADPDLDGAGDPRSEYPQVLRACGVGA